MVHLVHDIKIPLALDLRKVELDTWSEPWWYVIQNLIQSLFVIIFTLFWSGETILLFFLGIGFQVDGLVLWLVKLHKVCGVIESLNFSGGFGILSQNLF